MYHSERDGFPKDIQLKSCPFCGSENLEIGVSYNPFIVWDDAVRGEMVSYVVCECGVMIKKEADLYKGYISLDADVTEFKRELHNCMKNIADKWNERTLDKK